MPQVRARLRVPGSMTDGRSPSSSSPLGLDPKPTGGTFCAPLSTEGAASYQPRPTAWVFVSEEDTRAESPIYPRRVKNMVRAFSRAYLSACGAELPLIQPKRDDPAFHANSPVDTLDLPLFFPYSTAYANSAFSEILRGLLQKMQPRCAGRNRPFSGLLHHRGVLIMRREKALSSHRGDSRPAAFCPPQTSSPQLRYFGKGDSLMVLPSRADCLAASRICITTTFVSSEVKSPSGFRLPLSTATR
jgi:hypothetical protein